MYFQTINQYQQWDVEKSDRVQMFQLKSDEKEMDSQG